MDSDDYADSIQVNQVDVDVEKLYRQEQDYGAEESSEKEVEETPYLQWHDFAELFDYPENDRSKQDLKRDFKALNTSFNSKVKFKSLVGKFFFNVRLLSHIISDVLAATKAN